jgi:hypothetical protein
MTMVNDETDRVLLDIDWVIQGGESDITEQP